MTHIAPGLTVLAGPTIVQQKPLEAKPIRDVTEVSLGELSTPWRLPNRAMPLLNESVLA